ncbi:hypothetical protein Dimus_019023 [Dionaea muscipula]
MGLSISPYIMQKQKQTAKHGATRRCFPFPSLFAPGFRGAFSLLRKRSSWLIIDAGEGKTRENRQRGHTSSFTMKRHRYSYHRHQANLLQLKLGNNDQLLDRISELPDEVLFSILSRLSLQEAARTTVLSRRWRYVWKLMMFWTLTLQKSVMV